MNLPNKISLFRCFCVPLFVLSLYLPEAYGRWVSIFLFALASFSDFLDGYLARKHHLVTDFGKFIDPLADKLLNLSALIMLCHLGLMYPWVVILILARELAVDGLRMLAVSKGRVLAAGKLGKIKTVSQMITILYFLIFRIPVGSHLFGILSTGWIVLITLWSGIDYFVRNKDVFAEA